MWIGEDDFDDFGYQGNGYLKGRWEPLESDVCYRILDVGLAASDTQYHFTPVDRAGAPIGPPAARWSGQAVYSIWSKGRTSSAFDISDQYIG